MSLENLTEAEFQELVETLPAILPSKNWGTPITSPKEAISVTSNRLDPEIIIDSRDQVDFKPPRKHKIPEIIALRDESRDPSPEPSDFSDQEHHSIVRLDLNILDYFIFSQVKYDFYTFYRFNSNVLLRRISTDINDGQGLSGFDISKFERLRASAELKELDEATCEEGISLDFKGLVSNSI